MHGPMNVKPVQDFITEPDQSSSGLHIFLILRSVLLLSTYLGPHVCTELLLHVCTCIRISFLILDYFVEKLHNH